MNVLIINGSPRKTGTTTTVTKAFSAVAEENGATIRTHYLNEMRDIHGCQSCTNCFDTGQCVLKDDFSQALHDHHWADVIVWSTPVYVDDMTGILKLFTDRMLFSNVKPEFYQDFENPVYGRLASGKQFVLIQTQAAPTESYRALFDKCTVIMRDTGVHTCHWLECSGLWIDENAIEGQAERLQSYELNAMKLAEKLCSEEKNINTMTHTI